MDFASVATGNQSFTGTIGDDVFIGARGIDTVTTKAGVDIILASSGDDIITIDGSGNKTINGGSGTDSLTIDVASHTSLSNYSLDYSDGTFTLNSLVNGDVTTFSSVENLTIGSQAYSVNIGEIGTTDTLNVIWGASEATFYGFGGSGTRMTQLEKAFSSTNGVPGLYDARAGTVSFIGSNSTSSSSDTLNLGGVDRSTTFTGDWNIALGDGDDGIYSARLKNDDSIDMGAGNDTVYVMVNGSSGTPSFTSLSLTKLDAVSYTHLTLPTKA